MKLLRYDQVLQPTQGSFHTTRPARARGDDDHANVHTALCFSLYAFSK